MSINTSNTGLPQAEELEKLANALFKLLPHQLPEPNFSMDLADHPRMEKAINLVDESLPSLFIKEDDFRVVSPQTSLPDPHFAETPEQRSAFGLTPAGPVVNALDLTGGQPESPGGVAARTEYAAPLHGLSPSVAGSGISPYAVQEMPGYSHAFPSDFPADFQPALPVLRKADNSGSISQFPLNATSAGSSYYFLQGAGLRETHFPGSDRNLVLPLDGQSARHAQYGGAVLDVNLIKKDFPILLEQVNGRPLIWLDNAATTQKPKQVIDRITYFYEHENSNIHRAAHALAARATNAYEAARKKVQTFLNARSVDEIIFVRGATEAINLVAKTWGDQNLNAGDEIIVSNLEHHANIVPWQQLAAKKGLKLRVIPVDDDGQILLEEYAGLLNAKTRLVSFTLVSNALGTVTPARKMVEMAHAAGAKVLVDGAQSVSHLRSDVTGLNCDWFVFSGHKVFGPTGIGVLYGKEEVLNATQPWQGGGNMIKDVTFEYTQFHDAPSRFEAGTGNIADAVGLGAAIDYVNGIGIDLIHRYEHDLLVYATGLLKPIPGLRLIGTAPDKASVLSFVFAGYQTEEVGAALNQEGIAVRSGHHCAQPILRRFGVETTVRPSLAFYNSRADIELLVETLYRLRSARK